MVWLVTTPRQIYLLKNAIAKERTESGDTMPTVVAEK
jgi:hypothetical protein